MRNEEEWFNRGKNKYAISFMYNLNQKQSPPILLSSFIFK